MKNTPNIIGLTGGIGSGKSTIANYFLELGVPVYIADEQAKKIMNYPETIEEVQAIFEENIINSDGFLDRKKIASIVFDNTDLLNKLNQIIHPKVNKDFKEWLANQNNHRFIIKEVAILFETNSEKNFDKIILVTAPEHIRIQRVIERDNASEKDVIQRIKNQLPDEVKASKSDYIIYNIDKESAKKQANKIFESLNSK